MTIDRNLNIDSILNWETNWKNPHIEYYPAIIRFLGYDSPPAAKSLKERLVLGRTAIGFTQEVFAEKLGIDQYTLARWQRSDREPSASFAARAVRVLSSSDSAARTWRVS